MVYLYPLRSNEQKLISYIDTVHPLSKQCTNIQVVKFVEGNAWNGHDYELDIKNHKPGLTPVSPIIIISRWGKQTARMHDLGWIHSSDLLNYIWVQQTARIHLNNLKMSQVKDRIGDADCSRRGWYHKMKWYSNYSSESSVILTNRQPAQSSHKSQPIIGVKTIQLGLSILFLTPRIHSNLHIAFRQVGNIWITEGNKIISD